MKVQDMIRFEEAVNDYPLTNGKTKSQTADPRDLAIAHHFFEKGMELGSEPRFEQGEAFESDGEKNPVTDFIRAGMRMGYNVEKAEVYTDGDERTIELRIRDKTEKQE